MKKKKYLYIIIVCYSFIFIVNFAKLYKFLIIYSIQIIELKTIQTQIILFTQLAVGYVFFKDYGIS